MKYEKHSNLLLVCLLALVSAMPVSAQKGGKVDVHEATIQVYKHGSKTPVPAAELYTPNGNLLGKTNDLGVLAISLPPSTEEVYVVRAEGFNVMTLRLTQAAKKNATYEMFLQPVYSQSGSGTVDLISSADQTPRDEMVKVYVKQDPETVQSQVKANQNTDVLFAVQLAATSKNITDKSSFSSWNSVGPVFIHREDGLNKVRIGPYATQEQAKAALNEVKAKGKKDAFIVIQEGREENAVVTPRTKEAPVANTSSQEEFMEVENTGAKAGSTTNSNAGNNVVESVTAGEYKVRLISYLKPGGFNPKDIDGLGTLESYRQGDWTIILIGGINSKDQAFSVRNKVVEKGYKDARVVMDNDGILQEIN